MMASITFAVKFQEVIILMGRLALAGMLRTALSCHLLTKVAFKKRCRQCRRNLNVYLPVRRSLLPPSRLRLKNEAEALG